MYDERVGFTTLPFRVIDVGSSGGEGTQKSRLYTPQDRQASRYLTLSHCWGKVIPPRLTRKSLGAWHVQIPDEELPKTFRDAIWLTRELGERFLWIDSICIVQDDPAELGTQIGLMGAIFEQSFCTISAVDAKGEDGLQAVDSGLFVGGSEHFKTAKLRVKTSASRTRQDDHEDSMTAQHSPEEQNVSARSNEMCEVILQEAPKPAYPFPLRLEAKAWHSRGWVFQERELSRRCIFFTMQDLGWRCNRYWETEQTGVSERRWHRGDYSLGVSTTHGGVSYDPDSNLRKTWQNAVEKYSATKLTFDTDKHNALLGFEERLATRFGYVFHHGIVDFGQSEHLHSQLLWIPAISRGELSVIRFPSWSWMNVKAAVRWARSEYLVFPELLAQVRFDPPRSDGTQSLHISGPFQTIRIGTQFKDIPHHTEMDRWAPETHFGWSELDLHTNTNVLLSSNNDQVIGWVVMDVSPEFEAGEVSAFPLLKYLRQDDDDEPMCVDFVAVSRDFTTSQPSTPETTEIYRRVGQGRVLKSAFDWLESCQNGDISII